MAGDWIKMRVDLLDDPAVIRLTENCGLSEFEAIGRLYKLWAWADRHTTDGKIAGVTKKWVDKYIDSAGFSETLEEWGWIAFDGGSINFVNFEKHNGKSAKLRENDAARQRSLRKRKGCPQKNNTEPKDTQEEFENDVTELSQEKRDACVTDVTELSQEKRDALVTDVAELSQEKRDALVTDVAEFCDMSRSKRREEKRREEKNIKAVIFSNENINTIANAIVSDEVTKTKKSHAEAREIKKTKAKNPKTWADSEDLVSYGLSEQVALEYLAWRNRLKKPLTLTAWIRLRTQLDQSILSPDESLSEAMAKGWLGFKAQWLLNEQHKAERDKPLDINSHGWLGEDSEHRNAFTDRLFDAPRFTKDVTLQVDPEFIHE